jgi:hypothetical protein
MQNAETNEKLVIKKVEESSKPKEVELQPWPENICMENEEPHEQLVVNEWTSQEGAPWSLPIEPAEIVAQWNPLIDPQMVLISRYPSTAGKRWIVANEKEAVDWKFEDQYRRIQLDNPIRNAM